MRLSYYCFSFSLCCICLYAFLFNFNLNLSPDLRPATRSIDQIVDSDRARREKQYDVIKKKNNGGDNLIQCGIKNFMTIPQFYHKRCSHQFKKSVTFFHVGKAGGGTIKSKFDKEYRTSVTVIHPAPTAESIKKLQKGPSDTLIFNIRDPVDRFVSAFRWRLVVLCSPDDKRDKRDKRIGRQGVANHPGEMCKNSSNAEEKMLREKYQSNPSLFGEALCSNDKTVQEEAIEDYSAIGHSMMLVKWIDFLIDPTMVKNISKDGIQNFLALPMEMQDDGTTRFDQHIHQMSLHLLQTRYDAQTAKEILEGKQDIAKTFQVQSLHSSRTNSTVPSGMQRTTLLSPLAECCLTRHLKEDYQLIQTMLLGEEDTNNDDIIVQPLAGYHPSLRRACSWGDKEQHELCRSDLQAMLMKRARYLDLTLGTCPEISSSNLLR